MRLKHYDEEVLCRELLSIIGQKLDLKSHKVFFFGSRVTGEASERSDIDVGILGPSRVPREALSAIKDDIDSLPILYKIDIVDFRQVSGDFDKVSQEKEYLN